MRSLLLLPILIALAGCSGTDKWNTYRQRILPVDDSSPFRYKCRKKYLFQINLKSIRNSFNKSGAFEGVIYDHRSVLLEENPCLEPSRLFENPKTSWKLKKVKGFDSSHNINQIKNYSQNINPHYSRILTNCLKKTHWIEKPSGKGIGTGYKYTDSGWLVNNQVYALRLSGGSKKVKEWKPLNGPVYQENNSKLLRVVCNKSNRNLP